MLAFETQAPGPCGHYFTNSQSCVLDASQHWNPGNPIYANITGHGAGATFIDGILQGYPIMGAVFVPQR